MMAKENKKVKLDNVDRDSVILFSNNDYHKGFDYDHDDPMVITTTIHNYQLKGFLLTKEA